MRRVCISFSIFILFGLFLFSSVVFAQDSSSTNYELDEVFLGPGGTRDSSSTSYNADGTLGDIGIGESASTNFNLLSGFTTDAEPTLLFSVDSSAVDLGLLELNATKTGNATFSVGTYNADGYVVQTISPPPTYSGHTLDNMDTQAASQSGTEQFGINLVANTAPTTFGADPAQIPDSSFSFGYASTNYDTADQYRYNNGDVIAQSDDSTGQTDYTISYIANISNLTPAGEYTMNHILVATSTY